MNPGINLTPREQVGITYVKNKLVPSLVEGIASYDIRIEKIKRRSPAYSLASSKQNVLFDQSKLYLRFSNSESKVNAGAC